MIINIHTHIKIIKCTWEQVLLYYIDFGSVSKEGQIVFGLSKINLLLINVFPFSCHTQFQPLITTTDKIVFFL